MNHTTPYARPSLRRGITLLEVLVSMFVLLFGLMGVAAVFPVASFYVTKGEQSDVSSSVVNRAFDELRARGMLRPEAWWYGQAPVRLGQLQGRSAQLFIQPENLAATPQEVQAFNLWPEDDASVDMPVSQAGPGHAFVIDPVSSAELFNAGLGGNATGDLFPYTFVESTNPDQTFTLNPWNAQFNNTISARLSLEGQRWPVRRISLAQINARNGRATQMSTAVAERIFTIRDDLAVQVPDQSDQPSILAWQIDQNGTPTDFTDDIPLQAQINGAYSWIATVVPTSRAGRDALQPADGAYGDYLYDVSVVTFFRRVALPSVDSERLVRAELLPGGELVVYADPAGGTAQQVDDAVKEIREGNWIALTGVNQSNGAFIMQWYRVLSVAGETEQIDITGSNLRKRPAPARRLYLAGPDWPAPQSYLTSTNGVVHDLRAIMLPGAISVVTRQVRMEAPTAWSVN